MSQEIDALTEMGFSRENAERALAITNNRGVEPAMEWLLAHALGASSVEASDSTDDSDSSSADSDVANSLTCDACGKLFAGQTEIEYHAAKTGHFGFPESTEEKKPLTDEEKKEKLAKIEERLKQNLNELREKLKFMCYQYVAAQVKKQKSEASDYMDAPASSSADSDVAISLTCDDCGKLLAGVPEIEYHAAKTGHSLFSESTEEKKPLTEEEKKERRKEREEKLKAEELEEERIKIKSDKDMQKEMEERRRDKLEDQKARDRVRQNILADKEARRLAAQRIKPGDEVPAPAPIVAPPSSNRVAPTSARLQLRLPDGRAVTQTFGAQEPLSAVRLYLQDNEMHNIEFGLMTTFPRRVFIEEDYEKPLDTLGLTPSAVVIVSKVGQPNEEHAGRETLISIS